MSNKSEKRWDTFEATPSFFAHLETILSDKVARRERIMALMERSAIQFLQSATQFSVEDFYERFGLFGAPLLVHLEEQGLAQALDGLVLLTDRSRSPVNQ